MPDLSLHAMDEAARTEVSEVPGRRSRRVRVIHYCPWADALRPAMDALAAAPSADLRARVGKPGDPELMKKARLDRDWHLENVRAFATMKQASLQFLDAWVVGAAGLQALVRLRRDPTEERWLVFIAQHPQPLEPVMDALFTRLRQEGMRILYYAFDEASRRMACFSRLAPHLDVLIHDEEPLAAESGARLRADCLTVHRSWVANVVPFAAPFEDEPEDKILFLGSQLGLTPHRQRQIAHLQAVFKERFVASTDHSVSVGDRYSLNKYKVGFCPEGRMFASPAMAMTHTDRPFWSGCLGMVPVSENSREGGRLEELAQAGLIERYAHGDLKSLTAACERALAMTACDRRRIYEHFNRRETVGTVVAEAIDRFV